MYSINLIFLKELIKSTATFILADPMPWAAAWHLKEPHSVL